jgi:hypothetical protein
MASTLDWLSDYDITKGNKMNDQVTTQMAEAQVELEAVKAKEETDKKVELFAQTPTDVGNEEKPIQ